MYTQNKRAMRALIGIYLPGMVVIGMTLLAPETVQAQSAGPPGRFVSKTKQEADRLVAITQPGYYSARLVPDWRLKQVDRAPAVTAATMLCSRSRVQTVASPTLELSGERLDEKQVQLTWDTSNEVPGYTIAIERSLSPAEGFETVTAMQTTGAASQTGTRQAIDPNANAGYTYYRLKRTERMGTYSYSQTVAVKGELRPLGVKAFPNPGRQNIRFQLTGPEAAEAVSGSIYDVQGRIIYQYDQIILDADRQFALPIWLGLQPGSYYLNLITKAQQVSTRFIVQP